jgi:hypothetical protein
VVQGNKNISRHRNDLFMRAIRMTATNNLKLIIMKAILIGFTVLSGLTSIATPIVSFNDENLMTNYESIVALLFYGCGALAMIGTITIQLTAKK